MKSEQAKVVKWPPKNQAYRQEYNRLTKATFGFDFEDWYQDGYWQGQHCPYSLFNGQSMVANVSLNPMKLKLFGEERTFLQLGTVMTDKTQKKKGYARQLMEKVIAEYEGAYPLIYLFANQSVLEFYPRFGFERVEQYYFTKEIKDISGPSGSINNNSQYRCLNLADRQDEKLAISLFQKGNPYSDIDLKDNLSLQMFYAKGNYRNKLYYAEENETLIIGEIDKTVLSIYDIFNTGESSMAEIIATVLNKHTKSVRLMFTPKEIDDYRPIRLKEDVLFVKGKEKELLKDKKFMFSHLSHT